ncbi:MAG: alpha/beta hydrolase family protein [Phycisphaerales bacterium]
MLTFIAALLVVCWQGAELLQPDHAAPASAPSAAPLLPKSFERHEATDAYGRTITYYIRAPLNETDRLPLVLYIGGSGAQSAWQTVKDTAVLSYGANSIAGAARGRARVVVVERPGVQFLGAAERPGSAEGSSDEFRREHTLDRWSEANRAALDAALKLPGVDPSRVLVAGHSEGGLVACRVAALEPRVTHVTSAAGGGVTQLFDLMVLAKSGAFCNGAPGPECEQNLIDGWKEVLKDPESSEKMWLGHAYRRWSSFLASSPLEELAKTDAKIYLAHGSADQAVAPASCDALYAQLLSRGRDVTANRMDGADHSFGRTDRDGKRIDGWQQLWTDVIIWYLGKPAEPEK